MTFRPYLTVIICTILLLTAGCFGRGGSEEEAAAQPSPTAVPTEPSEPAQPEPTEPQAGESTEAPAPADSTGESDSAESDAAAALLPTPTPTPGGADAAETGASANAATVENAQAIRSYRLRITIDSTSARGEDAVRVEGAYVKEPPAEELNINFQQGEEQEELAMIMVGGARYIRSGDTWIQSPEAVIRLDELTLMTPQDTTDLMGQMEQVGVETVNGRQAMHYRGDQSMIPAVGTEGDTLDVSQIESAQLDLWVDQEFSVVSQLRLEASENRGESPMSLSLLFEYYDFNTDITITAPADAMSIEPEAQDAPAQGPTTVPAPEGDSGSATGAESGAESESGAASGTTLGSLLGFDLSLPEGTTVQAVVEGSQIVLAAPMPMAEAENLIDQTLPNNGYNLITKTDQAEGQIVYAFQQGQTVLGVVLVQVDDSNTRLQFSVTP